MPTACKSEILIEEVTIDPQASRSVRFGPLDEAASDKSPTYWIFRATLRDGSMFAIDPCNAQYSFTTAQERNCGVFPWNSYLSRLSLASGAPVSIQPLGSHAPSPNATPIGNIEDGKRHIFVDADIRSTAESMGSKRIVKACITMPATLTLDQVLAHKSNQIEYAANVRAFKNHLEAVIEAGRTTKSGVKDVLMDRLHRKG